MPIKGTDVAIASVGGLFVYAGIRGYSPLKSVQNVIQGQPAGAGQAGSLIGGAGGSNTSNVTNSQIANAALKYVGTPYTWAGKPGTQPMVKGIGPHDCSSLCNWILGHDLGFTLPGETQPGFDGLSHGPDTIAYLGWNGAETIGHSPGMAEAGDLCVWQTHMGVATGNGQMVSARSPATGTGIGPIDLPGEVLFVRRLLQQFGGGNLPGPRSGGRGDIGGGSF